MLHLSSGKSHDNQEKGQKGSFTTRPSPLLPQMYFEARTSTRRTEVGLRIKVFRRIKVGNIRPKDFCHVKKVIYRVIYHFSPTSRACFRANAVLDLVAAHRHRSRGFKPSLNTGSQLKLVVAVAIHRCVAAVNPLGESPALLYFL